MTRHPAPVSAPAFFATTFALSWAVWVPLMLVRLGVLPRIVPLDALTSLGIIGVLMPAVAATWLTARSAGRAGVRRLWRRLVLWRIGRWWLPALLLQPVVLVAVAVVHDRLGAGDPVHVESGLSIASLLVSVLALFVAASGEEIGWRGLALPALQARSGPVLASTVLALLTATWHVPYWVLQGALADRGLGYMVVDCLFFVALTFQLTWLVNGTRGSVLVAVVFHVSFNTVNVAVLPVTESTSAFAVLTAVEAAISLLLLRRIRGQDAVGRPPTPRRAPVVSGSP